MKKQMHTPKELGSYIVHPNGDIESRSGWRGTNTRFLDQQPDDDGYLYVRLVLNGKRKKWRVHRLMAELFLEPRPSPRHEIRHLDGNRRNNAVENLAWGTRKDNADDRESHGRTSRGKAHSDAIKKAIAQSKANARLIAASPDLLRVAKLILEEWDKPTEGVQRGELIARLSQYVDIAREAVNKAEGKQ